MQYFLLLTLCICLISTATTRPSRLDERNAGRETEEAEYEANDDTPAEDGLQEDEEARLNVQQDPRVVGRDEESARGQPLTSMSKEKYMMRALADERADRPNNENLLEYSRARNKDERLDEETSSSNDPSLPKRRQSNRYIENSDMNDTPESVQRLNSNYKMNRLEDYSRDNEIDKRTADSRSASLEDSDSLFDNQRPHRYSGDKSERNNEVSRANELSRNYKQYYANMQADHKNMLDRNYEMAKFLANRDRRQAEHSESINLFSTTSTEKVSLSDSVNEDDEAAIKRHIKKLSGEELEELLNSLSDDKKALLNKIMESNHDHDTHYDSLKKREITKKAGAVEENNFIDNGLSELSKMQGVSASVDLNTESAVTQNSDNINTKPDGQSESNDVSSTKVPETTREGSSDNKAELTNTANEASNNIKLDVSLNAIEDSKNIIATNEQPAKTESKRETNNQDYLKKPDDQLEDNELSDSYPNVRDSDDSFNDQDNFCSSQDEDLSELMDEEAQLHHNQEYKREALYNNQADDDSFRSLEESFPHNECDGSGQYFESNMAPLIRVKRKEDNLVVKKRAAAVLPDAKVAFVPYKAENDDEDNDEGSEFDDDGFYDRTSNYAKNSVNKPDDNIAPLVGGTYEAKSKLSNGQERVLENAVNEKVAGDSIGTDTDSVLSGVEGVDENLMFNSGTRNRRNLDGSNVAGSNRPLRSTPLPEDATKESQDHINIPNYQESDAFGALPRNYEGELGRYKRIRRVKTSSPEEAATNT